MEVDYYPIGHKLHLLPNFEKEVLEDSTTIQEAFERIVQARKKVLTKLQMENIIDKIKSWLDSQAAVGTDRGRTNSAYTVGMLRKQDREKWNALRIPIMAREFLRELVNQAQDLNYKQILECQFNRGMPIEWEKYNEKAEGIINMGFDRKAAVEALVIKNLDQGQAIDLLLTLSGDKEQAARDWDYEKDRSMKSQNRCVAYNAHHSVVKLRQERAEEKKKWLKVSLREIRQKIKELTEQIELTKTNRRKSEEELRSANHRRELERCSAFLKGLIDSGEINTVEMQKATTYMKPFSDEEKLKMLKDLGTTLDQFENMKNFEQAANEAEEECNICYEPGREYMFVPCGHISLCEDCADNDAYDKSECYQCRKKATSLIKVLID